MSVSDSYPSLPWKQSSSDSIPSCNTYFPISAENSCRLHACVGGGGVWWLRGRRREAATHWKLFSENATVRRLQRFFKEEFKSGRYHQMIERIREVRGTMPPLGLLNGNSIGERSMGDIVDCSPEFISM